jgi:hypothetical protein
MKIRVVSSREEIFTHNPNERIVHLTFRSSNKDILAMVETCPKIEAIRLPKSYMSNISKSIEMFLTVKHIQLLEGDVWGHRKDLNEYYSVPSSVIEKIKTMKIERKSTEDIEKEISKEANLKPEMIAYIMSKEAPV